MGLGKKKEEKESKVKGKAETQPEPPLPPTTPEPPEPAKLKTPEPEPEIKGVPLSTLAAGAKFMLEGQAYRKDITPGVCNKLNKTKETGDTWLIGEGARIPADTLVEPF